MRFVYFKRIAAIFAAMLCTCQTGSAANGCLPFANCLPDQMYHPVTRLPDGRFVNDKHDDAVVVSKMLVNRYGWATGRAGEPGVSPNWRQVEFYKAFLEFREEGHAFTDDRNVSIQSEAILAKLEIAEVDGTSRLCRDVHSRLASQRRRPFDRSEGQGKLDDRCCEVR